MLFLVSAITSSFIAASYYFTKMTTETNFDYLKFKVAWYGIKTYCFFETILTQISRPLKQLLHSSNNIEPECILFVRNNGDEIVRHTETAFRQMRSLLIKGMDYDFIIYEFAGEKGEKYDKYLLFFDDHMKVSNNFKLNSTMKLLGVSVKIRISDEAYYKVSLNYGRDNYFIVGNKLLGRSFLNWFFKGASMTVKKTEDGAAEECNLFLDAETKYFVSFIDQKMQCIELTDKQYIVINEEGYTICKEKEVHLEENENLAEGNVVDNVIEEEEDIVEEDDVVDEYVDIKEETL
jgi:hypothetical protein